MKLAVREEEWSRATSSHGQRRQEETRGISSHARVHWRIEQPGPIFDLVAGTVTARRTDVDGGLFKSRHGLSDSHLPAR